MEKIKRTKGFTLIELLVAMGILGIVGGMSSIILFTTLKSASKSDIMREVKQNGDYSLSVMERMIRNASMVTPCPGVANALTVSNPDGQKTTFAKQNVAVGSITVSKIASNSGSFLTNNNVSLVGDISFNCTKPVSAPAFVSISFTLSQAGTTTRVEEKATVYFHTSVSLRTY